MSRISMALPNYSPDTMTNLSENIAPHFFVPHVKRVCAYTASVYYAQHFPT